VSSRVRDVARPEIIDQAVRADSLTGADEESNEKGALTR